MWLLRAHPLAHTLQILGNDRAWHCFVWEVRKGDGEDPGDGKGLWLPGLSRWAISLFLVFLQ